MGLLPWSFLWCLHCIICFPVCHFLRIFHICKGEMRANGHVLVVEYLRAGYCKIMFSFLLTLIFSMLCVFSSIFDLFGIHFPSSLPLSIIAWNLFLFYLMCHFLQLTPNSSVRLIVIYTKGFLSSWLWMESTISRTKWPMREKGGAKSYIKKRAKEDEKSGDQHTKSWTSLPREWTQEHNNKK